jgi:hypothetical protein
MVAVKSPSKAPTMWLNTLIPEKCPRICTALPVDGHGAWLH